MAKKFIINTAKINDARTGELVLAGTKDGKELISFATQKGWLEINDKKVGRDTVLKHLSQAIENVLGKIPEDAKVSALEAQKKEEEMKKKTAAYGGLDEALKNLELNGADAPRVRKLALDAMGDNWWINKLGRPMGAQALKVRLVAALEEGQKALEEEKAVTKAEMEERKAAAVAEATALKEGAEKMASLEVIKASALAEEFSPTDELEAAVSWLHLEEAVARKLTEEQARIAAKLDVEEFATGMDAAEALGEFLQRLTTPVSQAAVEMSVEETLAAKEPVVTVEEAEKLITAVMEQAVEVPTLDAEKATAMEAIELKAALNTLLDECVEKGWVTPKAAEKRRGEFEGLDNSQLAGAKAKALAFMAEKAKEEEVKAVDETAEFFGSIPGHLSGEFEAAVKAAAGGKKANREKAVSAMKRGEIPRGMDVAKLKQLLAKVVQEHNQAGETAEKEKTVDNVDKTGIKSNFDEIVEEAAQKAADINPEKVAPEAAQEKTVKSVKKEKVRLAGDAYVAMETGLRPMDKEVKKQKRAALVEIVEAIESAPKGTLVGPQAPKGVMEVLNGVMGAAVNVKGAKDARPTGVTWQRHVTEAVAKAMADSSGLNGIGMATVSLFAAHLRKEVEGDVVARGLIDPTKLEVVEEGKREALAKKARRLAGKGLSGLQAAKKAMDEAGDEDKEETTAVYEAVLNGGLDHHALRSFLSEKRKELAEKATKLLRKGDKGVAKAAVALAQAKAVAEVAARNGRSELAQAKLAAKVMEAAAILQAIAVDPMVAHREVLIKGLLATKVAIEGQGEAHLPGLSNGDAEEMAKAIVAAVTKALSKASEQQLRFLNKIVTSTKLKAMVKAEEGSVLGYGVMKGLRLCAVGIYNVGSWVALPFKAVWLATGGALVAAVRAEKGLAGAKAIEALKGAWEALRQFGWYRPKALVMSIGGGIKAAYNWVAGKVTRKQAASEVAEEKSVDNTQNEKAGFFAGIKGGISTGWGWSRKQVNRGLGAVKAHKAEAVTGLVGGIAAGVGVGLAGAGALAITGAAVGGVVVGGLLAFGVKKLVNWFRGRKVVEAEVVSEEIGATFAAGGDGQLAS